MNAEIVLLDLKMPVLDGFEFFHAYSADPPHANTIVVVMSADDQLERRAIGMGARGFVRKPFAVADLLESIEPTAIADS